VAAAATSEGLIGVAQEFELAQVVGRAAPLIKITDAAALLPVTKFTPWSSSGNPSTDPAVTLEGKIASIVTPLMTATFAVAVTGGFVALVASTVIALGEGALDGAV
jgi:hypothetical protein